MKKLFYLLAFIGLFMVSCDDDCTQDAYCQLVNTANMTYNVQSSTTGLVTICHYGSTIEVDETAVQSHLDHGDALGECISLSAHGLEFRDGEIVDIPCSYELPFIHTTAEGQTWYYSSP